VSSAASLSRITRTTIFEGEMASPPPEKIPFCYCWTRIADRWIVQLFVVIDSTAISVDAEGKLAPRLPVLYLPAAVTTSSEPGITVFVAVSNNSKVVAGPEDDPTTSK
jgi:hypothetical protein